MTGKILSKSLVRRLARSKGMAATEFVIIWPILGLLIYGAIEVNSLIEHKIHNEIAVRNLSTAVVPDKGREFKSTATDDGGYDRAKIIQKIANLSHTMDSHVTLNDPANSQGQGAFATNKEAYTANFRNRFKTRGGSTGEEQRKRVRGYEGSVISNHNSYENISDLMANATNLGMRAVDFVKRPVGFKMNLFVDDIDTTMESQFDLRLDKNQGVMRNALGSLTELATRSYKENSTTGNFDEFWS